MPVLTDTLADDIKGLTASVNGLREDFAGWKGSVETELSLIRTLGKWILAAFTSIAIVALTGAGGLIWSAATLSGEVKHQGGRLEKIEVKLDKVDQRLDQVERRFDRVVVEHHLPAVLVGEDQRQIDVGVAAQTVIGIVVEDARPGIILPVVVAAQRARPIRRDRQRVLRAERHGERRRVGQFVAAQILGEAFAIVGRGLQSDRTRDSRLESTACRRLYRVGIA